MPESANSAHSRMSLTALHKCMGHIAPAATRAMVTKNLAEGLDVNLSNEVEFCEACVKAKITRQPVPSESSTRATRYGERIHSDVWGPAQVQSLQGKYYYVSFTDDYSRETTRRVKFLRPSRLMSKGLLPSMMERASSGCGLTVEVNFHLKTSTPTSSQKASSENILSMTLLNRTVLPNDSTERLLNMRVQC